VQNLKASSASTQYVALHQSLLQRYSSLAENLKASPQQNSIAPIFAAKMQQQLAQSESINQWEQCEYCSNLCFKYAAACKMGMHHPVTNRVELPRFFAANMHQYLLCSSLQNQKAWYSTEQSRRDQMCIPLMDAYTVCLHFMTNDQ
jgi:hypothetical protein